MNIVLIGMPGCRKSTVGVVLAKALEYSFIDSDLIIQRREKMSLQKIINSKGIKSFLKAEEDAVFTIFEDEVAAIACEKYLKKCYRKTKEKLITQFNPNWNDLYETLVQEE